MVSILTTTLRKLWKDEAGEGMVGWIVAALLTVAIVVVLHGLIKGWLPSFWGSVETRINDIV